MAEVTITVVKNGPLVVAGDVDLRDMDGNQFPSSPKTVLCRCGASTRKPFCDGTHGKVGFAAAEQAVPGSSE